MYILLSGSRTHTSWYLRVHATAVYEHTCVVLARSSTRSAAVQPWLGAACVRSGRRVHSVLTAAPQTLSVALCRVEWRARVQGLSGSVGGWTVMADAGEPEPQPAKEDPSTASGRVAIKVRPCALTCVTPTRPHTKRHKLTYRWIG